MEAAGLVLILISAFACLARANSLEYSDLEALGLNCSSSVASCTLIDTTDFFKRNCECDRNCVIYQDCCVDARVRATARSRLNSAFTCMPYGVERELSRHVGAYVVQTCSRNYNGPSEMQRKCRNQNNVSDPVMSAPVTDTLTDTTYRNRYCAECNSVDTSTLQSWLIHTDCTSKTGLNVTDEYIWQNLQYRPNINKWGLEVNSRFYACDINYEIPTYLQQKIRLCRSEIVSSCPRAYPRQRIKELCNSYMAVIYSTANLFAYKNPHCAICNGISLNSMTCDPGVVARNFGKKKPFSFALLLDVNQSDGDIVGVSIPRNQICGTNQKYDPYFKKCRNLVCALPGYVMVNGKCKKP